MAAKKPATAARKRRSTKEATAAGNLLQELRRRIANQVIPPGSKLLENDLAGEFGVSRARVRDALAGLERYGLIVRIPNRGAMVSRPDLSAVRDLYDVREVLEGLCVRLATKNVPKERWQDLVELFNAPMKRYVEANDFESFLAGYGQFRQRVLEAADNRVLSSMLDMIYDQTQTIIRRLIVLPGRAGVGLEEHRAVLAAMRKGDAEEAERLRRANMRSARAHFERYQSFVL